MNKLWIVGPPGSGKSTLSKKLCKEFNIDVYELDELYWKENWTRTCEEDFRNKISLVVSNDSWIIDGYYEQVEDLVLENSDIIILLEQPVVRLLFRVVKRSLFRIISRKQVCNGNRENLKFLISKEGILIYTINQKNYFSKEFTFPNEVEVFKIRKKVHVNKLIKYLKIKKEKL